MRIGRQRLSFDQAVQLVVAVSSATAAVVAAATVVLTHGQLAEARRQFTAEQTEARLSEQAAREQFAAEGAILVFNEDVTKAITRDSDKDEWLVERSDGSSFTEADLERKELWAHLEVVNKGRTHGYVDGLGMAVGYDGAQAVPLPVTRTVNCDRDDCELPLRIEPNEAVELWFSLREFKEQLLCDAATRRDGLSIYFKSSTEPMLVAPLGARLPDEYVCATDDAPAQPPGRLLAN